MHGRVYGSRGTSYISILSLENAGMILCEWPCDLIMDREFIRNQSGRVEGDTRI